MKKAFILLVFLLASLFQGCLLSTESASLSSPPKPGMGLDQQASESFKSGVGDVESVDRKLIRRANLRIEVSDFEDSSKRVAEAAEAGGGFVSDSNSFVTDTGRRRGTITVRVPESEFFVVVETLEKV